VQENDAPRVADALDPSGYIVHVTRTAILLEQMARDLKALRDQAEASSRSMETMRNDVATYEREFAVYKTGTESKISVNQESIKLMEERLRWLSRLVVGALITGVIGGVIALVFKLSVR
jgi:hypothetical protein